MCVPSRTFRFPESVIGTAVPDEEGRLLIDSLSMGDAERLLDWLEARCRAEATVIVQPDGLFAVRWTPVSDSG